MAAGRPKKPTALKKHEGTYRSDRALINEMMPALLTHLPSAPEFLDDGAKEEWVSVCSELMSLGMLHRVDLALLSAYCQEMSTYVEACSRLIRQGFVLVLDRPDGSEYSMPNPWVSIKNSSLKNAQTIASQFGFTPSARTKISTTPGDKESGFEEMMNMDDE